MIVHPNAKINIGLNITEKRTDGYHNIETVFYPIGLSDMLEISPAVACSDYSFSCSGFTPEGDPENNLVVKAYRLLQQDFPLPPIDISLMKEIPFGAGLGGGSSDAAFMLKALNELFKLELSNIQLETFASQLGADCPFFINNKAVYATGIGNVFSPIELSLKDYFLLLIKPEYQISTHEAYATTTVQQPTVHLNQLIKLPIDKWRGNIKNDFERSVFSHYPQIKEIKNQLYEMGALYASMSGSGSSVYGIFKTSPENIPTLFEEHFITGGYLK